MLQFNHSITLHSTPLTPCSTLNTQRDAAEMKKNRLLAKRQADEKNFQILEMKIRLKYFEEKNCATVTNIEFCKTQRRDELHSDNIIHIVLIWSIFLLHLIHKKIRILIGMSIAIAGLCIFNPKINHVLSKQAKKMETGKENDGKFKTLLSNENEWQSFSVSIFLPLSFRLFVGVEHCESTLLWNWCDCQHLWHSNCSNCWQ